MKSRIRTAVALMATAFMTTGCFLTLPGTTGVATEEYGAIRYVGAHVLNVRSCPDIACEVSVQFYRGQMVEVFETQDGWARISQYYDASVEGIVTDTDGEAQSKIARWASSEYLWKNRPGTKIHSSEKSVQMVSVEGRIRGIPTIGENGFTAEDAGYLRDYATKMIKMGGCSSIEYADKSVIVDGRYYVHCEGEKLHRFFFPNLSRQTASAE